MSSSVVSIVSRPARGDKRRAKRSKRKQLQRQITPSNRSTYVVSKPRRQRRSRRGQRTMQPALMSYINTLINPFEYPPVRLGWGTMVPTNLYTAIQRFTITASSDGYFAVFMSPTLAASSNSGYQNVSTGGAATWTPTPAYPNASAILAACSEGRIISGGIKVFPQVAATSPPGILYAGSIPATAAATLYGSTLPTLIAQSYFKVGYGATGACALIHPTDPYSFVNTLGAITGYSPTVNVTSTTPIIIGTGFPSSCSVVVEFVLNLETILGAIDASAALTNPGIMDSDTDTTMSSLFTNVETMWRTVKQYVPSSSSVNEAATNIQAVGNLYANARNVYNNANRRERQQYFAPIQGNRVIVEEME